MNKYKYKCKKYLLMIKLQYNVMVCFHIQNWCKGLLILYHMNGN